MLLGVAVDVTAGNTLAAGQLQTDYPSDANKNDD
jgi:hypothetical protein